MRSARLNCGSTALTWQAVSGKGEIYSYTVVHRALSKGFADQVPYVVAVVALAKGPRLMTRLTQVQLETVRIGMPVQVDFEKQDEETILPVFRPEGQS